MSNYRLWPVKWGMPESFALEKYPDVLAIAASAALCSLALRTREGVTHWQSTESNQHSEQLLPAVTGLLSQAGIDTVDLIAVDIGPGAFTSVRVACGVAQGLALGWQCEVMAVQSLSALAQQVWDLTGKSQTLACILDARMNECYVALYSLSPGGIIQTQPPRLIAYDAVKDLNVDTVVGNGAAALSQWATLAGSVYDALPSASGVLAYALQAKGAAAVQPEHLQPLYVRNQVALTAAQRAAGMVL
jgi:tRNA threonylcarbamoyladenosine biosynthesis protein TsaB